MTTRVRFSRGPLIVLALVVAAAVMLTIVTHHHPTSSSPAAPSSQELRLRAAEACVTALQQIQAQHPDPTAVNAALDDTRSAVVDATQGEPSDFTNTLLLAIENARREANKRFWIDAAGALAPTCSRIKLGP